MNKKFYELPIDKKIPFTKKSIQDELDMHEGGYPKHVSMNANYMLEIFDYVKELEKFKADAERLYKYTHLNAKKSIEDKEKAISLLDTADDELQYASTTGDDSNRDFYIKNAMRFIQESIELLK